MYCPFCNATETKVIDSRLVADGTKVRRRRECITCNERFTTFETAELVLPRVIKSDGNRETFNENKLKAGILRALEKRPVDTCAIDRALDKIKATLRACGEREVTSKKIGDLALEELKDLDRVAFIRFASVYRSFDNLGEFIEAINNIEN